MQCSGTWLTLYWPCQSPLAINQSTSGKNCECPEVMISCRTVISKLYALHFSRLRFTNCCGHVLLSRMGLLWEQGNHWSHLCDAWIRPEGATERDPPTCFLISTFQETSCLVKIVSSRYEMIRSQTLPNSVLLILCVYVERYDRKDCPVSFSLKVNFWTRKRKGDISSKFFKTFLQNSYFANNLMLSCRYNYILLIGTFWQSIICIRAAYNSTTESAR